MEEKKEIRFQIEGVSPIKMDKWLDLPQPIDKAGYLKQAKEKAYRDNKGNLAVPAVALKACIREASADEQFGKKKGKQHRQEIQAQLFISPDMLSLGKKNYDGIADDVVSRISGKKITRVTTYRPLVREWKLSGTITLYGLVPDHVKEILQTAGFKYGLLGHRPEFGRFIVSEFGVMKDGK